MSGDPYRLPHIHLPVKISQRFILWLRSLQPDEEGRYWMGPQEYLTEDSIITLPGQTEAGRTLGDLLKNGLSSGIEENAT